MTSPDWFRWYPTKWLSGVLHLNNEQRGVYIQVVNVLLDRGECSADPSYIGRLCNCNRQKAARIVVELITRGKLYETDGKLHQNRAESERKDATERAQIGTNLSSKRWKNNAIDDAAPHMQTTYTKKERKKEPDASHPRRQPASSVAELPLVALDENQKAGAESAVALGQKAGGQSLGAQPDLDALYYQRGKALLGQKAGGQLTKLRAAVGSVGAALQIIDDAQRKESPAEYVSGCIRNKGNGHARPGTQRASVVDALRRLEQQDRDQAGADNHAPARQGREPER